MKKKFLALLMSLVLVIGVVAGSSLAWLLDTTPEVKNTFTDSDINISLIESASTNPDDGDGDEKTNSYQMIPGWTIEKDPLVTVQKGSEACYVFVKIDKSSTYETYLAQYVVDDKWTALTDENDTDGVDVAGVYYQELTSKLAEDWSDYVLKGAEHKNGCAKDATCDCANLNGYVSVREDVTKEKMNALKDGSTANPTLTFTAYASQYWKNNTEKFSAYDAWVNVYNNPASANP